MTLLTKLGTAAILALTLTGIGAYGWHSYENAVTERATFKLQADDERRAKAEALVENFELRADGITADTLVAKRTRELKAANLEKERLNAEISRLIANPDAETARWASHRVPVAAADILCRAAGCADPEAAGARPSAGSADGPDAGPAIEDGPDERGIIAVRARRLARGATVQR